MKVWREEITQKVIIPRTQSCICRVLEQTAGQAGSVLVL